MIDADSVVGIVRVCAQTSMDENTVGNVFGKDGWCR